MSVEIVTDLKLAFQPLALISESEAKRIVNAFPDDRIFFVLMVLMLPLSLHKKKESKKVYRFGFLRFWE